MVTPQGAAQLLYTDIGEALRAMLGVQPLDQSTMRQACLPTALGGMGLPPPTEQRAAAAVLATHETHIVRMPHLSAALGREWSGVAQHEAAEQARAAQLAIGIQVRGDIPALAMNAREECAAGPWAKGTPVQDPCVSRCALERGADQVGEA